MKHFKWPLIAILSLSLVLGSLAACGGPKETKAPEAGPTPVSQEPAQPTQAPTPEPTVAPTETPQAEVEEEAPLDPGSLTPAEQFSSYRSQLVSHVEGTEAGQPVKQSIQLTVEYTRDPMIEHVVLNGEGLTEEEGTGSMEVYQTADRTYMKWEDQWMSVTSDEEQPSLLEGMFTPEELLKDTCGWKKQRDTELNGVKVHHWTMDRSAMEKCMTAEAMSDLGNVTDAQGDLYVAVDGNYVAKFSLFFAGKDLKISFEGGDESLDEGRWDFSYEMTDVNRPFTLEIPPEALASGAMPEDIPVPDDAEELENVMGMISFKSAKSLKEVADFYKAEMPKKGWTESNVTELETMYMLEYSQDGRTASVMISTDEESGKTSVVITIQEE